jgi:hypothetical protein
MSLLYMIAIDNVTCPSLRLSIITGGLLSTTNSYHPLRPDDALYLLETMGLLLGKTTGLAPSEQQHSLTQVIASVAHSIHGRNASVGKAILNTLAMCFGGLGRLPLRT